MTKNQTSWSVPCQRQKILPHGSFIDLLFSNLWFSKPFLYFFNLKLGSIFYAGWKCLRLFYIRWFLKRRDSCLQSQNVGFRLAAGDGFSWRFHPVDFVSLRRHWLRFPMINDISWFITIIFQAWMERLDTPLARFRYINIYRDANLRELASYDKHFYSQQFLFSQKTIEFREATRRGTLKNLQISRNLILKPGLFSKQPKWSPNFDRGDKFVFSRFLSQWIFFFLLRFRTDS